MAADSFFAHNRLIIAGWTPRVLDWCAPRVCPLAAWRCNRDTTGNWRVRIGPQDERPNASYNSRLSARSSMDRVLLSEGRGCWFDPSRAHQFLGCRRIFHPDIDVSAVSYIGQLHRSATPVSPIAQPHRPAARARLTARRCHFSATLPSLPSTPPTPFPPAGGYTSWPAPASGSFAPFLLQSPIPWPPRPGPCPAPAGLPGLLRAA
jgi:hypothetical protein